MPEQMAVGPRERARRVRELEARIGRQVAELRNEAGIRQAALARSAGIDPAYLWRIEGGTANPSLAVLVAIAACLGGDLGVRIFPGVGPRIHDRFQAPMVEELLREIGPGWRARPEVPLPAARGVADLVLDRRADALYLLGECHSEIRRLELVLRRIGEKATALGATVGEGETVSSMLVLRWTQATRAIATRYEATLSATFPASTAAAVAALRGDGEWPGPAILWMRVEAGRARLLDRPPRGVRLGR